MSEMEVRMLVDSEICIGGGQCEMVEEETFLVDDETVIATVIGTGRLPLERAERIAATCPSGAISFELVGAGDAAGAGEAAAAEGDDV